MSQIDKRVQINKIIESQLPEFLIADFPKAIDFFKQYYISQEIQGGNIDIVDNLDQYIKVDNLVPEVVHGKTTLSAAISATDTTITVPSTKGFPDEYGLLKIGDEIITYTGKTTTTFTGCVRGFSGVTGYNVGITSYFSELNRENLVFSTSSAAAHAQDLEVTNLSVLFLQEFYKKLKATFVPGLENIDFVSDLDVGNFIKHARNLYQSKGIEESIKILFKVLYGVEAKVLDLEERLIKPSSADYIRRELVVAELIGDGDPFKLEGQTIYKSTDMMTSASISEVEIFTRFGKPYYRLALFIGYNDRDLIEGTFTIPGNSKTLESVSIGSSIISVDSTIGFDFSGTLKSGDNTIVYTSKSVNQFFGCSGVTSTINLGENVRSDETVFGYEDGDISKRVDLRITGVLSDFVPLSDFALVNEGEKITVRHVGDFIENPEDDKTYKQIFANSWIYNTSSRFQVETINGSTFTLRTSDIDKSSLRVGDTFDVLVRNVNTVVVSGATVSSVNPNTRDIILSNLGGFTPTANTLYDIRRRLRKVNSTGVPLLFGNDNYLGDTLNVYTDENNNAYVASNSLPGRYNIQQDIVQSSIPDGTGAAIQGFDPNQKTYSIISFPTNHEFIDGDKVVYTAGGDVLPGLVDDNEYYVSVVDPNKIRLYISRALLASAPDYLQFGTATGSHTFTLVRHKNLVLNSNKVLRKFPLKQDLSSSDNKERTFGVIGMMVDGVEISSPHSLDTIYFGPLERFDVLNGGSGYDVINAPKIEISAGLGTVALVEPIIEGSVESVTVDQQDFDIDQIFSVSLTGGNGTGCFLEPVMGERFRELEFDSRSLAAGGGIGLTDETITFQTQHNLKDGEPIIYNRNGNDPLSIGIFGDTTNAITGSLSSGETYISQFVNTSTIKLYNTVADYNAGINTIGFSTSTNASGFHKFRTLSKKTLKDIKVLSSGSGYTHRKLSVKSADISTEFDTINFENHGFSTGDIVTYTTTGTSISGVSTTNQYYVLKHDDDSFRIVNAGIGGTVTSEYTRKNYVQLGDQGSGSHVFQYPPIEVTANVSYGSTLGGTFVFTPKVTGTITDAYLYEKGTGYGSNILNLDKKPLITLKSGKNAELKPIIVNGRIVDVQVLSKGTEYFSVPDITVIGDGTGAILRAVVVNQRIDDVIVINGGIGYGDLNTTLKADPRGKGGIFDSTVRKLIINDAERYGQSGLSASLYNNDIEDALNYSLYGYSETLANNAYSDDGTGHSPIVGWAYDGNPIYGPYAFSNPESVSSVVKLIEPSYTLDTSKVFDRPAGFAPGFFVEDYDFTDDGDLDRHNGRFCKTPDFPNGVYAYFVGVTTSQQSNNLVPKYPYFIGNHFRSDFIEENEYLDQIDFDFNESNLARNTYPYKVFDLNADNDFIVEPYEDVLQIAQVEAVSKGTIDKVNVIDGGSGYRIGDEINFDDSGTNGIGLRGLVSELKGSNITKIETEYDQFNGVVFTWDSDREVIGFKRSGFNINNGDGVFVSGLTTSITNLSSQRFKVGLSTEFCGLAQTMTQYSSATGIIEDIHVSPVPQVSIGGSAIIAGSETVKILNVFQQNGVLRVKRFASAGVAHTYSSDIDIISDRISIKTKTPRFDSRRNHLIFFNTQQSVGVGTTAGGSSNVTNTIGGISKTINVPNRQIYIPNHPFKTGDELTFIKSDVPGVNSLIVGNDDTNLNTFQIPDVSSRVSTVYAINRGRNYIGLTTTVGLTTFTDGLFFYSNGSDNSEYSLETNYAQITGDVERTVTTVSVGETHGMQPGDRIKLSVQPNAVVGYGTTAPLTLKFIDSEKKLLVNQVGFDSSQINTAVSAITIASHGFETGDKVYYDNTDLIASGLSTGSYYVVKVDNDQFKLSETLYETNPITEKVVSITGIGGSEHFIGLINPKIDVVKNSKLSFNLSDSSLVGYDLRFFYEKDFVNEFVSTSDNVGFNISGIGTAGIGTASLDITFSNNIPGKLYYGLEKGGYISTADRDVTDYSQIEFIDSKYNGTYDIFGITTNTFKVSPVGRPEVNSYSLTQLDSASYITKSSSALSGSVSRVTLLSDGFGYKQLPKFIDIESENGSNANIVAISTSVGKIKKTRILDVGFEYSSDKTLRPEAFVAPVVRIDDVDTIDEIILNDGGSNYISAPNLILYNDTSNQIIDSSSFLADTPNASIFKIDQIAPVFGLQSEPHRLVAINNSNGVGISSIVTSNSGIASCTLVTPIAGFSTAPFRIGDEMFVEGIELVSGSTGTGYNSADHQYRFFRVDSYIDTNPALLEFKLVDDSGVGLTTNPGIAKTFQSGYATLINKKNYPDIEVIRKRAIFSVNEVLFVDEGTGTFKSTPLKVTFSREDFIKIEGKFPLKPGHRIKGQSSGAVATITEIEDTRAKFTVNYSSESDIGWRDDVGKISEDYQVTPNNDYYQNLSYSVKSPIPWETFSSPVNSIVHPAGLKNFADVGITSEASTRAGLAGTTNSIAILDVVNEKRVDVINNFDNVTDYDTRTNPDASKFLKLSNRKLTDYTQCRTNLVLIHDDISDKFSSKGSGQIFIEVEEIKQTHNIIRYLIQVRNPDNGDIQLNEFIVQTSALNSIVLEKYKNFTNTDLGDFTADVDAVGRRTLIFTPTDPYNRDHDIKIIKRTFETDLAGIGTQAIGSIDIAGINEVGISSVGTATSIRTITSFDTSDASGMFASLMIKNTFDNSIEFVEAVLDFDSTNTFTSEYFFDTQSQSYSTGNVGLVTAIYDSSAGIVTFSVKNTEDYLLDVKAHVIKFKDTSAGIGTYRFLTTNQPPLSERSARLESTVGVGTTAVQVAVWNQALVSSVNSLVRVSTGSTSALHQISFLQDANNQNFVFGGPYAGKNNTAGLGTFGVENVGLESKIYFYPDSKYANANASVTAQAYNEVFYSDTDFDNEPLQLPYGTANQRMFVSAFDGINGARANKTDFTLKHEGKPIYINTFDPADANVVDPVSGIITIKDHFLNTGEELIYKPDSSFIGIGKSAIGIGQTANYLGIVTDRLPERVFPIALTPDTFKLSTQRAFALAGIAVTFTDSGVGNAHKLEMTKKLSKTVVSLDGIVQQPVTFTAIAHELRFNGTGGSLGIVGAGVSTFAMTGISSVQPRDLLKIGDEYMKVVEVGLSTRPDGDIGKRVVGIAATFPVVSVKRASIGSTTVDHTDGATVRVHRGAFDIVESDIHFIDPPKGAARVARDASNLPFVKANFAGRTFLRSDYTTNMVFDDISDQFTGIGRTFTMTVGGANTTGVDVGNGILFINGVFQTPTTVNNAGNNYEFQNDTVAGISSVVFTGITSTNGQIILSDSDVNQNQLPRGGMIVSLGSTPGLGYAPLVGAITKVDLIDGGFSEIVGVNTYRNPVAITTAAYDKVSGIIEIETSTPHYLKGGDRVQLVGLHFTCTPSYSGVTTTIFPDHDRSFDLTNILSATKLKVNVGTSTITHNYVGFGSVFKHFTLNHGSGYRGPVSIGVTDLAFEHRFVRAGINSIFVGLAGTTTLTATDADFTSHTGELKLTVANHGLQVTNQVGIDTGSIVFTCSEDNFFTEQSYPRSSDPVAGIATDIIAATTNTFTVKVGPAGGAGTGAAVDAVVGAGGTLAFNITSAGSGYVNPRLNIPDPSYENIPVVGVSRLGIGATTETGENILMNLKVGAASTNVGIGSTLFQITDFEIARPGYNFQIGDRFKPVGLVTDRHLSAPISEVEFEVIEVFNDFFSAWSFGEMDYIDSIALIQDGSRTRFPLYYNGQLLSFEKDPNNPLSAAIDLDAVLLIFVNGVIQSPKSAYSFQGGTSFIFSEPPKASDKVDIFFYVGTEGVDVTLIDVNETIKVGDDVFVGRNPNFVNTRSQLRNRTIVDILGSDLVETDNYIGAGINETNPKPIEWHKQKIDRTIKGENIFKVRESMEPHVYPTAKIIGDLNTSDTSIFVDDAQFFKFEETRYGTNITSFDALVVEGSDPVGASLTATVSASGQVTAVTIVNPGIGYSTATVPVKFTAPPRIGVGIGSTATATGNVVSGEITSITITNPGFGYTNNNNQPITPQVIAEVPEPVTEFVPTIREVQGFSGIITGISTTTGTGGHPLAIKFNFRADAADANDLVVGYPVMINDTKVGTGVTSVGTADSSPIGIGTQFLDNVYIVATKSNSGPIAEITCNVHSTSAIAGIAETGFYNPLNLGLTTSLGRISWGRLFDYERNVNDLVSIGVTGLTIDAGLSTFPSIQRRTFGLRNTGAIRRLSNNP